MWISSFIGVSVIGLIARYLDDVEQKLYGRLKLRNTNLFCATFTSAMAVFYCSVTLLQAGRGTFAGFEDLLVGKIQLTPLQEFQACVIHSFMFGYMVQDLLGRFIWGNYKWSFILHHAACIVGLALCLVWDQSAVFGSAVGISESTTPLVAIIEIARADKMDKLVLVCGLLLNLVFPFRVALFTWVTYLWAFEHIHAPFGQGANLGTEDFTMNLLAWCSVAVLTALNWIWWKELVFTTAQVLLGSKPKAPTKAD